MSLNNVLWSASTRSLTKEVTPVTLDELAMAHSSISSGALIQVCLGDELRSVISYGGHSETLDASLRAWNVPFRYGSPEIETADYKLVGAGRANLVGKTLEVYGKSQGYGIEPNLEATKLIKIANPEWRIIVSNSQGVHEEVTL